MCWASMFQKDFKKNPKKLGISALSNFIKKHSRLINSKINKSNKTIM